MNMKINVGIVGYGNLGKSVENLLQNNENYNIIAIFSRRDVISVYGTKIENYNNYLRYKNKIDIMILCGGSLSDIEVQITEFIKYFDCINTFDNHCKIFDEKMRLDKLAKKYKHRLIMSCGWDPGIFSIIRAIFYSINKESEPITFWGKGISLGHSEALRRVDGVIDAVQFTVPNLDAVKLAKKGINLECYKHNRECYVASLESDKDSQERIENDIKNIPNYFKGQPTTVKFISKEKIEKLKKELNHKGQIYHSFKINNKGKYNLSFSTTMSSNPDFTASIVISYLNAIINLKNNKKIGTFTTFDIPISYLYFDNEYEDLIKKFC